MRLQLDKYIKSDANRFASLGARSVLALGIIVIVVVAGQVVMEVQIARQLDAMTRDAITSIRTAGYITLAITLVAIALVAIFIFRPMTRRITETIHQLMQSEKNARKLSQEIGELYSSLEKTYEQMAIVNEPAENPRLLAKADRGGNATFVAEPFAETVGLYTIQPHGRLADLFPGMELADDWMDDVVDTVSEGKLWQGEVKFRNSARRDCWFEVLVTPTYDDAGEISELVMLGTDISSRKIAEQSMKQKNRAEIEKKINQQKFRSVLILEGQEEERKRIAMDIHDGIGQMLTSLKYQIESIDLAHSDRAREKIAEVDQLIKEIIREVRKVTFDLKPTVLGDYGLQAGLNVFIHEIGKLTGMQIEYRTSGDIARLEQKVENNIFRIVQEAVNNAIKYSGAERIAVSLKQSGNELVIAVKDEGKGFDPKLVEAGSSDPESGRGFFNMYERTEYINGNLEIQSATGKGTSVRLTVPLQTALDLE